MKLSYSKTSFGRPTSRSYEVGETPPRYGIARQLDTGEYEFMMSSGSWSTAYATIWINPPHHYLGTGKDKHPGAFIVNFNKPKSPQPTKGYLR
jgi:hypothetical protein